MSESIDKIFEKCNDFDNICNISVKKPKSNGLMDFLKVTTSNGDSDVYDSDGNRLSFKNKKEIYDIIDNRR